MFVVFVLCEVELFELLMSSERGGVYFGCVYFLVIYSK